MDTLQTKTNPKANSERLYRIHSFLLFAFGLVVGCLVAYAEHLEWLPNFFSNAIHIERFDSAMLGACLTQTAALPLVFVCGLHRTSYFYASRILCVCYWFLKGVELIHICMTSNSTIISAMFLGLLIFMALIMMRAVFVAAQGVTLRHRQAGISLFSYCYHALRLWGALLLVQLFFNIMTLWLI